MNTSEQNNIMIAEFMGWIHSVKDYHGINLLHYPEGDKLPIHCKQTSLSQLKYSETWDCLMSVVDKIEQLKEVDEFSIKYDSVYKGHYVNISPSFKDSFKSIYTHDEIKIKAAYMAVVEFIKWFNQNK